MLSKKVKYALKALIYISKYETINKSISAKNIAESEKIPYKFLETILRELKQHKILKSERGAEGGYTFLKKPEEVSVADIIRFIDGPIAMVHCVSLNYYKKCEDCFDEEHCSIKDLFEKVRDVTLPILQKTIKEMVV
jgi:Rrf2 family protein